MTLLFVFIVLSINSFKIFTLWNVIKDKEHFLIQSRRLIHVHNMRSFCE